VVPKATVASEANSKASACTYSPVHSFNHVQHSAELSSWQSYSADRTQIHP
jgi:hypothetical protein